MRWLAIPLALVYPLSAYATENSVGLGVTNAAIVERALEAGQLSRDDFASAKPDLSGLTAYASHNDGDFIISIFGDPDNVRQIQIFISTLTNSVDKSLSTAGDIVNLIVPDHPAPHPNIAQQMPTASRSTQWASQKFVEAWEAWPGRGARKEWRDGEKSLIFEGNPPDFFFLTIHASSKPPVEALSDLQNEDHEITLERIHPLASAGDANAQYEMGEANYFGHGMQKNHAEAVRWYRLAAEQGHAMAQLHLGKQFPHGSGIEIDPAERLRWLGNAADQGSADAYHELATWQFRDPRDADMAAKSFTWCAIAAELGDGLGQLCVATRYRNGWGVERDDVRAYTWATIALSKLEPGFNAMNAAYMQADYGQNLGEAQIAEAAETTDAWTPKPFEDLKSLCGTDDCAIWR